ncbi:MAG: lamin tail domain-containing protein, partial [Chthoniobacteraceae bacterium]
MIPSPLARLVALLFLTAAPIRAEVVLNEVMSAGSERALQWSAAGVASFGFGTRWTETAFNDAGWQTGVGPFGFGTFANVSPAPTVGTSPATQMQNLTPTLYLRKTFTVSATDAARTDALLLDVQFNDGFVCYINGVEVARQNAGPVNGFLYHDQFAAFGTPANSEVNTTPYLRTLTLTLPPANTRLLAGTNVIAIHALNYWDGTSVYDPAANTGNGGYVGIDNRNNFYIKADLRIAGASPVTFVANNTMWRYFPGLAEPSGGVYDPAFLTSAKQRVPWGRASYDDTAWASGPAPIGTGSPGITLGTPVAGVVGQTPSVYCRIVFNVTAADLADPLALQLLMGWDDAFVAYVNGVEVARDRLAQANAFTPHDAVADSVHNANATSTTYTLDPPAKLLNLGQNVLAVQVHNLTVADLDLFMRARLQRFGAARILVDYTNTWKYFVGVTEPVLSPDEAIDDDPEAPDSQLDWIELRNTGLTAVPLDGWKLSDELGDPAKWQFPAGTNIPAGGHLLVVCDGEDITAPASGGYLHANFKLNSGGETLTLRDQTGAVVQQIVVPALTATQSYGRNDAGVYAIFGTPTPLAPNTGATFSGIVEKPTFSVAGGFYTTTQSVSLATITSGASIRYTIDGSEPTETTGTPYTTALSVLSSRSIRARAFKSGMTPSATSTRTYLIAEPTSRKSVPALCITGDQARALYRPFGNMSIVGGSNTALIAPQPTNFNGVWTQATSGAPAVADLTAYDHALHRGRFMEKPATMEVLYPDGRSGVNTEFGMRISGSGHARPRYKLTNQNSGTPNTGAWSLTDFTQKPSFNFYFRDDLGGDPLNFPLFPDDPITKFHDLRVRAGKNDVSNPFVEDELMRRLFVDLGQVGSVGIINTLYVNGIYKGYYNLCEHIREDFLQRHHGSNLAWDVAAVTTIANGDGLAFQEMITFIRNNPQGTLANYQAMKQRLDVVNFADYLILNVFGVTGDWPHNNYINARERSSTGLYRYYLWDAEGAFGDFSGNVRTNQFTTGTTGSIITNAPTTDGLNQGIRILYTLLRASPEFKLLFADRLQKHFFNGGALTEARVFARLNSLRTEFTPLLNGTAFNDKVTPWTNGVGEATRYTTSGATNTPSRRNVLFNGYTDDVAGGTFVQAHLVAEGLWPAVLAPTFSIFGGNVAPGFNLTISNPNGSGTVYYTTDGRDPRAEGGAIQGTAGTAVTINATTTVKARVRSTGGVWSAMTEALFDTGVVPSLLITEIMYHPPNAGATDGDQFEFIEVKNTGAQSVNLFGMSFTSGIAYDFPAGATIAPGQQKVIARNATQFALKYPAVALLGAWGAGSKLSNSGDTLTLSDAVNRTVFSVSWLDTAPWPITPDGSGPSLVPVNANAIPSPNNANNWRASTNSGGSPGADDPAPPTPPVLINEVLANAPTFPGDRIELFNPNAASVDVSDWWLSDDVTTPKKYRFPAGSIIAPGGFLLLVAADLNVGAIPFSFSANGDDAVLSSGDVTGALTGYTHVVPFGASEPGVSFGRHLNSQNTAFFVAQKVQTFGSANAGPKVGPVIISELMIEPLAANDEYVELRNIGDQPVPLFDPANPSNTWRVEGIGFNLPAGLTLQPRQVIVLSPIAPATFSAKYSVPGAVAVHGPFTGALNNGGERVALAKPGVPYLDNLSQVVVPYIDVDAVTYDDIAPWPAVAANGKAMERVNAFAFADDPQNWQASAVGGSIGTPTLLSFSTWLAQQFTPAQIADSNYGASTADPDSDGLTNFWEWALGLNPLAADSAGAIVTTLEMHSGTGPYLTLRHRRNLAAATLQTFADTGSVVGTWNLGAGITVGSPANNGDGTETITRRDTQANGGGIQRFIR